MRLRTAALPGRHRRPIAAARKRSGHPASNVHEADRRGVGLGVARRRAHRIHRRTGRQLASLGHRLRRRTPQAADLWQGRSRFRAVGAARSAHDPVHEVDGRKRRRSILLRPRRPSRGDAVISKGSERHARVRGVFARRLEAGVSSNRRKPGVFDVYVPDRQRGSTRRVYTSDGTAYATAWSASARQLLVRRIITPYEDNLYDVDLRSGGARLITPHAGQANFDSSQFTPDGRSVVA